jgi:peptidoglycan/LPS O-acetylase OafA/YrhL
VEKPDLNQLNNNMFKYRPDIDGLRALAVVPVILFHAGGGFIPGGFIGVDIFFVISGFLITSIILKESQNGKFSLVNFYERRARRILPALFAVMLVTSIFMFNTLMYREMEAFLESIVGVLTFTSNIYFWSTTNYFDPAAELKPLLHTWSLSVEEQFYVLFPLLFLLFAKKIKLHMILITLATVGSFALCIIAQYKSPIANFYLLPFRAWELLIGALGAYYVAYRGNFLQMHSQVHQTLSNIGLAMILYGLFCIDKDDGWPSVKTLIPVLGTLFILIFNDKTATLSYRLLSQPVMVGVGLISYSLYLWHQPILAFIANEFPDRGDIIDKSIGIFLCLVLSYLTWKYIERPFRDKSRINRRQIAKFSLGTSIIFLGFALPGIYFDGYKSRYLLPPNVKWSSLGEKIGVAGDVCNKVRIEGYKGVKVCVLGDEDAERVIALYGDSHAQALSDALDNRLKKDFIQGLWVELDGCNILPDLVEYPVNANADVYSRCLNAERNLLRLLSDKKVERFVFAARWSFRLYPIPGHIEQLTFVNPDGSREIESYRLNAVIDSKGNAHFGAETKKDAIARFVGQISDVTNVALMWPVPETAVDIFKSNAVHYNDSGEVLDNIMFNSEAYYTRNNFVISVFDELLQSDSVTALRADQVFCNSFVSNSCVMQFDSTPYYYDDDHLSFEGAELVMDRLFKE